MDRLGLNEELWDSTSKDGNGELPANKKSPRVFPPGAQEVFTSTGEAMKQRLLHTTQL